MCKKSLDLIKKVDFDFNRYTSKETIVENLKKLSEAIKTISTKND